MSLRLKQGYHHHHVISIMAPRPSSNARAPSSSRSSIIMYIRSSSSQLDQSPQELHHIIKIKQSSSNQLDRGLHHLQGLHHQQASSRHLQHGSISIIIMSKHHGFQHIIRILMGHQRTIISNQGSKHRTVTTARVTIKRGYT